MYKNGKCQAAAIICYLFTWIGWVIAFIIRDKDDELSLHHLNQGLILAIIASVATLITRLRGLFAIVGEIADVAVLLLCIMGIVRAAKGSDEPLPFVGDIKLL